LDLERIGRGEGLVGIDVDRPVEVGLAVPLGGLGLLVELVEPWPLALVVAPGEDGVGVVLDGVDRRGDSSFQTENSVIRSGSLAYSARSTT
jgi:hypothetical protein